MSFRQIPCYSLDRASDSKVCTLIDFASWIDGGLMAKKAKKTTAKKAKKTTAKKAAKKK
jgi:endogenous inhibitor of DNA gyrase (YacG/DUF329 family)